MNSNYYWWFQALFGIVALLALQSIVKKIIERAEKKNTKGWKARVGKIFRLPLCVLIWGLGVLYLLGVAGEHIGFPITEADLSPLRKTVVIASIAWIFYRWKREVESSFLVQPAKKVDSTTIQMVGKLATIAVGILAGLVILQVWGFNIAPLLAFGSIGAASIGFAGKDVMANFCSGIMLHITRPFLIGDLIYLPEKDLEGIIEEIGWFRTSIRDKEKRALYLPNNYFSTMPLVNVSRMTHRRLKTQIKISFDDISKLSQVVDRMRAHLEQMSELDSHFPIHVFLKNFGDYASEIEIDAYSNLVNQDLFNRFQHRVLMELQAILQEMDVKLALPVTYWKTT